MSFRLVVGLLGGAACWFFVGLSHAQCTKDTDCKGERVCEQGNCVTPPAPGEPTTQTKPASEAEPAAPAEPADMDEGTASAPPAAPAPKLAQPRVIAVTDSTTTHEDEVEERPRRSKRDWKRSSPGMMAGGIVMVSVAPIALIVSFVASVQQDSCERGASYGLQTTYSGYTNCGRYDASIYGGLVLGVGLLGAGIPMIIYGAKRKPLGTASVAPWATPDAGGLRLQLNL